MAAAYSEALDTVDRPLDPKDIEALYIGNFCADLFEGQSHLGHLMADWLGLAPRPATRVEGACASSGLAFREGVMAIASGMYDIVLIGGVEKMSERPVNASGGLEGQGASRGRDRPGTVAGSTAPAQGRRR